MGITEKSGFEQLRRNWNSRFRAWRIDRRNRALFGESASWFAERLWIPTKDLKYAVKIGSSKESGRIINHWPTSDIVPIEQTTSIKACVDHWQGGLSWQETGIYAVMMEQIRRNGKVDRLRTLADVKTRYAQLDTMYGKVRKAGRLSTRQELIAGNFREEGGILINIGPDGVPYFGFKGNHRLAMAIAAGLDEFPAQLGVIHTDGLESLHYYRQITNPEPFVT